ncbi:WG repeat-containing protein [Campylobacter coli]
MDSGGHFSEGLAGVKLNGKRGFIDKNGEFVIEPNLMILGAFGKD